MAEPPYCDAKDLKEVNFNMNLLIEKVNHENTRMVDRIVRIEKAIKNLPIISTAIIEIKSDQKANSRLLKVILGIIGAIGTIVAIGVIFT